MVPTVMNPNVHSNCFISCMYNISKYLNRKDDISDFSFKARPRWPLDPSAYIYNPIMKKIGKKGGVFYLSLNVNISMAKRAIGKS